jgi:RNA polymerase sigma-70 factor (ECF subfamily)
LTSDEEAEFTAMVLRQSRFVFRVAYAVLLNAQDAEDSTQETFLKLYRNGGWRGMENERAFLARATWRVAQDSRKQLAGMKRRVCGNAEPLSPANEPRSLAPGPEQAALDGDRQRLIHTLVDALPEDLRLPLMLSAFEELNSREIGGILSVPEGTVRTRIHRARLMIREKLAAHKASKSEHTVGRGHA